MTYIPGDHISVERRKRADQAREDGWEQAVSLMERGHYGEAYQRIAKACAKAWRIENLLEP